MLAIISDIHSNIEALTAVFEDIDRRGIQKVYCCGDIVGYGANPLECLDLLAERGVASVCGNHDQAVFFEPLNFNVSAERAAYWTRQAMEDESKKSHRDRRWELLGNMPDRFEVNGFLLVHASPRRPVNEYLFAEDVYTNPNKILANFDRLGERHRACLVGHTHVPGVFLDDPYFDSPADLADANRYVLTEDEKAIINVGSIGQPRDRDVRASYVVVRENGEGGDEDYQASVEFVRVEYDVELAVKRILAVPELDDFLGTRLLDGR
ncbi:MAG: metallophosphoesterase family protein [Phycisphaerales bacterium]|nr:MAG: metallophosphoesterase family protein [Phycisphaerales bacterium]